MGVLWTEKVNEHPALVIEQDGVERVRLPATGRVPTQTEDSLQDIEACDGQHSLVSWIVGAATYLTTFPKAFAALAGFTQSSSVHRSVSGQDRLHCVQVLVLQLSLK